jgi:hypothetical protein
MKQVQTMPLFKKVFQQLLIPAAFLVTIMIPGRLFAQAGSTKKIEPATTEDSALLAPSLTFVSIQKADKTVDLKATLKVKFKGSSVKLPLLKVTFLQVTDAGEKELGFVITDRIGAAVFNVKEESLVTGKDGKLHFKAVFAGNKSMEQALEEVNVKRARLEITPVKEDSLMSVHVKLIDLGSGTETPVGETVVGIFVKRSFYPLKIGEGTTDSTGEASVDIPKNLPGDEKGNITLLAKLDENEVYGNLEASVAQQWGVPVSNLSQELPRALWSSHPPIWMLVTFIVLMATVWGHYVVIIYELFRLRKEEPHQPTNATNI